MTTIDGRNIDHSWNQYNQTKAFQVDMLMTTQTFQEKNSLLKIPDSFRKIIMCLHTNIVNDIGLLSLGDCHTSAEIYRRFEAP